MKRTRHHPTLKRHHAMVSDPHRTLKLEAAIQKNVKPGSVVFDLGCGTGVLTLMALKAGAKKVYACEIDESIQVAQEKISKAGLSSKVEFFQCLSSEVKLPEKMDVIIAETVGSLGLNENILPFVLDARRRFLKKGGKIIPASLRVYLAPCKSSLVFPSFETPFQLKNIRPADLLASPQEYCHIRFLTEKFTAYDSIVRLKPDRSGLLGGFAAWFEVDWTHGITTKTSPWDPLTHWKQVLLPLGKPKKIRKGDILHFRLRLFPKDELYATESVIEWGCEVFSPLAHQKK